MQMHHLGDESATDDADAQSSLSQAGRDYTPVVDGRSICRVSPLTPSIAIAGAPVSFGAFEVTVGVDPHVPDALAVLDRVIAAQGVMMDFWREGAFCPLGDGDLDIDAILRGLRDPGFAGWLVVEQDMLPRPDDSIDRAARDQQRNREYLRTRGL